MKSVPFVDALLPLTNTPPPYGSSARHEKVTAGVRPAIGSPARILSPGLRQSLGTLREYFARQLAKKADTESFVTQCAFATQNLLTKTPQKFFLGVRGTSP